MSTITTEQARTTKARPAAIGVLAGVVAAGCIAAFAHDWREIAFSVVLLAVVTAVVFGVVVPRALRKESAGGTALALAIPAVLLAMPAFWSGLPLVLGLAGVIVGNAGRTARTGAGKCIAAVVLGALAVVSYVAIHVMSGILGEVGFLLN